MTEGQKERLKSHANFLNGIGIAFIGVVGIATSLSLLLSLLTDEAMQSSFVAFGSLAFWYMLSGAAIGVAAHVLAIDVLRDFDREKPRYIKL
jgi:ABC-type siderophore export system fused ATPase/permease subunit